MQSWHGVSEFVAVVELGSFSAASARLNVPAAEVSDQISALEAQLDAKLLYRTTRRVAITDAGKFYYRHCRQALNGLVEAKRGIAGLNQRPTGQLSLITPVHLGETRIAPLVNNFLTRYPRLEINLKLSNQPIDLISESYDLVIRLGALEDNTMMAKRITSRTHYTCASPCYLANYGTPQTPAELDAHNCLQGVFGYWRFQENGTTRLIKVDGNLRCNGGWTLVDAACKNIGIIQLPDYYVNSKLRAGRLVSVLNAYRAPEDEIWAISPQNQDLTPKVRLLLDFLTEGLLSATSV